VENKSKKSRNSRFSLKKTTINAGMGPDRLEGNDNLIAAQKKMRSKL
jgi:hypothetical protein